MNESQLPRPVASLVRRASTKAEGLYLRILLEVRGVAGAVRYLRNPDPHRSVAVLRRFGAQVGDRTTIKRSLHLDNVSRDQNSTGDFRHVRIGRNCYVGDGVYFDLANEVVLEDGAILSGHVSILTHADCNRSPFLAERFPRECEPVRVEEGAWIGFGATILAGTTIGARSVVAAQSLVSEDVEPESLYGGSPARRLRSLDGPPRE